MQFLQSLSILAPSVLPDSLCEPLLLTLLVDSDADLESTSSCFAISTLSAIFVRFSAIISFVVSMIPSSIFIDFSSSSSDSKRVSSVTDDGSTMMLPFGSK
ncbi:hypothetical protein Hdeb2414_s0014g00424151 [Helianthus debilis subsp. tardiflorus]